MGKPGFVKMMRTECKPARTAGWRRPRPEPGTGKACLHPAGHRWLVLLVLVLGATSAARAEPLAGRIWKPAEARFSAPDEVIAAARAAPLVLLGETHTIARHHVLQARLIRAIAKNGRRPSIVLEMVARDRQADIDAWRRAHAPDAAAFGAAVEWQERGWPPWSTYRPIVEAALAHGLPVRAGGPGSDLSRRVAEAGLAAVADRTDGTFPGLETPLDAAAERRLLDTLTRAHCGLPEHAPVDRMIAVQRLRDAAMAHTMLEADPANGAVLIAGRGHVRGDYGVPVYLQRRAPERDVLTIAFLGTANRPTIADQRQAAGGTLPFDFVWFTEGGATGPDCSADRSGTPGE